MAYNSGLVQSNVTFSGGTGLGVPTTTQTCINQVGTGNAATQNAYTCPANKIFYLYAVPNTAGAAQYCNVYKTDGATSVIQNNATGLNTNTGGVPIGVYIAGEIVKVIATAGVNYNIIGVLQSV